MWVGLEGGISRFDPATDAVRQLPAVPDNPASLTNTVWIFYQDLPVRVGQARGAVR